MVQLDRPEDEMTLFVNGDPVKVSKTKTKSKKDCPPEKRISVKGDIYHFIKETINSANKCDQQQQFFLYSNIMK